MSAKIITLSISEPKEFTWDKGKESSGIGKKIVSEARLTKAGFEGDGVANLQYHGGPERAVCVYPYEHYSKWEQEFHQKLNPPAFGENLCVSDLTEDKVYIGDIWKVGTCTIQVTQGRIPCATISKYNGIDPILKRLIATGYTGYFCKVLEEGTISHNAEIQLIERVQADINVLQATLTMFHGKNDRDMMERILRINELAVDWQRRYHKALQELQASS